MENWNKLKEEVKQLRAVLKSKPDDKEVRCLVKRLFNSSVAYYEARGRYASNETVLRIVSGRSLSPLEAAFMWLGAWRPSAAVSLIFSVMGVSKEGIPLEIPLSSLDLSDQVPSLSDEQLSQLASFQEHTRQAEKELSEELASVQMMLPDQDLVTQLVAGEGGDESSGKFREIIDAKVGSLREMLKRADQFRIKTLAELHSVLSPMQAAHCSITAFEVGFVMRSLSSGTPASTSSS